MATVTVPGARSVAWETIFCVVSKKVLTGKLDPLKVAEAWGVPETPPVREPVEMTLAGLVSMRKRPSPWVPAPEVAVTLSCVEPVEHPAVQVPSKTWVSSET
jgi:hypothetical protein